MLQDQNKSVGRTRSQKQKYNDPMIPGEAMETAVEQVSVKGEAEIVQNKSSKVRGAYRRVWYGQDKIRAAFLAGQGKSADEIARIIGGTTAPSIRTILHSNGVPLFRKSGHDDCLMLQWKKTDREAIEKHAAKRDRDPAELAALIVRKVMQGGDKAIDALVSEFDVIG